MAITANHFMLILGLLITLSLDFTVAQIGVNYGRNGAGLPPPSRVVQLYRDFGIQRMRIYDTDQATLQAVNGSNIELTVGILNRDLANIAASQDNANCWVQNNIRNYPNIRFKHIVVGNEVSPIKSDTAQYVPFVLRAMQNVYNALNATCLGMIKVTTAIETGVIDPSTNVPPEKGRFRPEVTPYLNPIIRFLMDTDAPLFASIFPYFAYIDNPTIPLPYVLLDPCYPGVGRYQNLFYAILDTVYAALEKSVASMSLETGVDRGRSAPVVKGGETGLPTRGGRPTSAATLDDIANVDNARAYVNNLIRAVKNGTPKRPGQPIETYIFAMFDENQKPGPEIERHFGLFTANGKPKYPVNFRA